MDRWEVRISWPTHLLRLVTLVFGVLMIAHWISCVLGLMTALEDDLTLTWLGSFGYCQYSDAELRTADYTSCIDSSVRYLQALYWVSSPTCARRQRPPTPPLLAV